MGVFPKAVLGSKRAMGQLIKRYRPTIDQAQFRRRLLALPVVVPGYLRVLRRMRSRSIAIVMYHGVTAERLPMFNWCHLDASEFEKQVEFLANEYTILHLGEVVQRMKNRRPLPKATACLTFDDGFRNVATTAFPILERRHVPATVFLVTSLVGTHQPAWPDRLYFSFLQSRRESVRFDDREYLLITRDQRAAAYADVESQLKQMEQPESEERLEELKETLGWPEVPPESPLATMGWEDVERLARTGLVHFGSHTHSHPILARCTRQEQRRQLQVSHDLLRERGLSCELFAYPNGSSTDFSSVTKSLLHELGYECGVTAIPGLNAPEEDRFELRRVCVGADMSLLKFQFRMVV
jgi:peptidoglycan/xylan/chitin deacetylase (PgdA/CDA1 family)